jgi:hypothetical protein
MQSPFWDADSSSAKKEFPYLLWKPKVHYRVQKIPPSESALRQINPALNFTFCFLKIHFLLSSHRWLGIPSHLFMSSFPRKNINYSFPHKCYTHFPFNSHWFDCPYSIWLQYSLVPCYFVRFTAKYIHQHCIHKHGQHVTMFSVLAPRSVVGQSTSLFGSKSRNIITLTAVKTSDFTVKSYVFFPLCERLSFASIQKNTQRV